MPRDVDVTTVTLPSLVPEGASYNWKRINTLPQEQAPRPGPSVLLNAAADVLDRDGWCQGDLQEKGTTRVCAIGAMMRVMGMGGRFFSEFSPDPVAQQAVKRLCDHLSLPVIYLPLLSRMHAEGSALAVWNNAPERTVDEVKAAMRAAAGPL